LIQKKQGFSWLKSITSRSGAGSHRNIWVSVLDLERLFSVSEQAA